MPIVCFDLDGTLTDPKLGITRSIRHALQRLNRDVPDHDDLTWCIGPPLLDSFEQLLGSKTDAQAALVFYRERFCKVGLYENEVYPGVPEALSHLAATGYRLLVATSKPTVFAERIVRHFDLNQYFSGVFGSELDGTRSDKTELLRWIISQNALIAEDTTMIGDRSHDIIGARNNGMRSIGVLYGYGTQDELQSAGADVLCHEPARIAELLTHIRHS